MDYSRPGGVARPRRTSETNRVDAITRREWLKVGAAGLGTTAWASGAAADTTANREYVFHYDHVIGTSLDLRIVAPDTAAATAAEQAVLAEIERLRQILSGYDPTSELSRLNRTRGPVAISSDLAAVLEAVAVWERATDGAVCGRLGDLAAVWKQAAANDYLPEPAALDRAVRGLREPVGRLDSAGRLVRTTDRPFDLNALGKAYIIDRTALRAQQFAPAGLINLGGDVLAWGTPPGRTAWTVGVQDPFRPFDNAAPIAGLLLENQAVASSGGYQRFVTVGGRRYSHVLDPRTGWPADGVAGATVVAPDAVTANALATALCVLPPTDGLRLVAGVAGAECLILAADGERFASPGLRQFVVARIGNDPDDKKDDKKDEKKEAKAADAWPDGFQVTVAVELPKIEAAKRYRRPYVAVWVEDEKGKVVRTLGVWGNAPKYLKDLSDWWKVGKDDKDLVKAVARATRGPGKYDLAWDGKDDKGTALPQGAYTVRVEVTREFGAHLRQSGKIDCKTKPATIKLEKNAETAETVVEFKKPEKPEKK